MTAPQSDSPTETRRKRLKFRALRRGFKEVDLVFGTFAEAELAGLTPVEMDQFEALLDAPDQDMWLWLQGKALVPAEHDTELFARMKALLRRDNPHWIR